MTARRSTQPPGAGPKASRSKAVEAAKPRTGASKRPARTSTSTRKPAQRRRRDGARLSPHVRPTGVDLHLELDPDEGEHFSGEVGITLQIARATRTITLHAVDLKVGRPKLRMGGRTLRGRVRVDTARECVSIEFDERIPSGHARLEVPFRGRMRRDLRALYRVVCDDRAYVFSQLCPTDARRVFPCFDEPTMKARFRITVTTAAAHRVLSNAPIDHEEKLDDGRKCVQFAPTPPLSSYLVAIAVGPLEPAAETHLRSIPIRVWATPGQKALAGFALEAARESLVRLEDWFALRYPYAKLDLIAVPEFAFGAMENAGAVFFRESLLLVDPKRTGLESRRRTAEIVCHELAHMWYGNLVTMAWWDDLWLNESFATWMAFEIVDAWQPAWGLWLAFERRRKEALALDALKSTHPVAAPVRSADEAQANFDAITYEKGASIVRMLERYLGPETFREGVRLYIRRHRESNAVAADLWAALTEVSGESVESIVSPWIERPGYPILSIRTAEHDGLSVLEVEQERLLEGPPARRPRGSTRPTTERWPIPWVARIGTGEGGESRTYRQLITRGRTRLPALGADLTWLYGNADESGFLRPCHAPDLMRDLLAELDGLEAAERSGLVDHTWALVRADRTPMSTLLDLLAELGDEADPDVLAAVEEPLVTLCRRIAPAISPELETRLRAWVEVYYGGQFDTLGWRAAPAEPPSLRLRRRAIVSIVGVVGRASALLDEARALCDAYLVDPDAIDPDLADEIVTMAALQGDLALHDALLTASRAASTPQERLRFLLALGDFTSREGIEATLALCHDADRIPSQELAPLLVRLFHNRAACEPTWRLLKRRWAPLSRRLPPLLAGRVMAATARLLPAERRTEVRDFFGRRPIPGTERTLAQTLERFEILRRLEARAGPALDAYLHGAPPPGALADD